VADVTVLDLVPIEAGAFYAMDLGHTDFARLHRFTRGLAFFIIRAKRDLIYACRPSRDVSKSRGARSDSTIRLAGPKTSHGTSVSAAKMQVWIAVCAHVLVATVKKELSIERSLGETLQTLSSSLFEKTRILQALAHECTTPNESENHSQWPLFDREPDSSDRAKKKTHRKAPQGEGCRRPPRALPTTAARPSASADRTPQPHGIESLSRPN
jgi:hypothetical protein